MDTMVIDSVDKEVKELMYIQDFGRKEGLAS